MCFHLKLERLWVMGEKNDDIFEANIEKMDR